MAHSLATNSAQYSGIIIHINIQNITSLVTYSSGLACTVVECQSSRSPAVTRELMNLSWDNEFTAG
ncbi:hypothetical protein L873DRAFT_1801086 [Choiromyces venosus 120613-1]|uniref:Uncharacterized protein n=1 Tax=Choiromyces venosus 120613-1 TaxID=1336337 RepID=A0A3N4JXD4_9PEZI|nr:hypothetical protein L873DRAFT_1801086 [Choiromyces venosus 120613-1]